MRMLRLSGGKLLSDVFRRVNADYHHSVKVPQL